LAAAGEGAGELDTGHLWPAGVYRQPYQPETARYGGSGLMGESESLFHVSSELALGFLRLCPPERARSGLGVVATRAALDVLADDDRRLRVCRRAAAGWRQWWQRAGGEELPRSPGESPPPGTAPAPVRRWVAGLRAALPRWQDEAGEEEAERILQSHIHMLHNRLGLSVAQEQAHYLALAAPPVPASAVPT
jgi:thiopeptide-type bacteriocin biosynthesis protein